MNFSKKNLKILTIVGILIILIILLIALLLMIGKKNVEKDEKKEPQTDYYNEYQQQRATDLKAEGAMAVLLKDAIKPNLVQTLEHTPAIIHGGPFANIAHGCNSVIATKLGMELAEYTVTEAGFGADLGAEKFIDIKCRKAQIKPDVVICVATIKALKYHGGVPKEEILNENIEALKKGMKNLYKHIDNLKNIFGQNVIVAINKFNTDTGVELNYLKEELSKRNIKVSIVEIWAC